VCWAGDLDADDQAVLSGPVEEADGMFVGRWAGAEPGVLIVLGHLRQLLASSA
jgi:hypothetical protein